MRKPNLRGWPFNSETHPVFNDTVYQNDVSEWRTTEDVWNAKLT